MSRGTLRLVAALAATLAVARPAASWDAIALGFDELVDRAARIVHGTVRSIDPGRDADGIPATWITLDVDETLKGPVETRLTYKQVGVPEPLPDGQLGSLCVTELYKTGSPQFRYNIMDLSYLYPKGQCGCGSWLRKMGPFAGRGDNMVKLRGVNVWPEGIGSIACDVPGTLPDYFVIARRNGARDESPHRLNARPSRRWVGGGGPPHCRRSFPPS